MRVYIIQTHIRVEALVNHSWCPGFWTHKFINMLLFFKQLTCVLGLQMDQKCIFCIKSLVTVLMWWWAQKPCLLSLALWGQSLYGKLQCIPLIHFHGEKSIKASIQLQQLLQDDVFVRPFKQNGQYIPNTPRQDRSVVGVWSFPKAFYCIKLITELSQPPFKNLKAHRVFVW